MSWLIYALASGFGLAVYNTATHAANARITPYLFVVILTTASAIFAAGALALHKMNSNEALTFDKAGITYAVIGGVAVGLVDVLMFMMFMKGGALSIAVPIVVVTSVILGAIAGVVFFQETFTPTQMLGFVMAAASIFLLVK